MKHRIIYSILFVFCFTVSLMAKQEKYVKHTVVQGETITQIAQKYKVTPYDIYRLNPDSQNGIHSDTVLIIPPSTIEKIVYASQNPVATKKPITHLVQPKETLYSISKQYNVSVEAIQNANAELLVNGLKIGQSIKIPLSDEGKDKMVMSPAAAPKPVVKETPKPAVVATPKPALPKTEVSKAGFVYHVIEPKETKYSVSKSYGVSIEDLERLNPQIVSDFPVGFMLLISKTPLSKPVVDKEENSIPPKPIAVKPAKEKPVVEEDGEAIVIKPVDAKTVVAKTVAAKPVVAKPVVEAPKTSGSTKKYLEEYVVRPNETIKSIANDFSISEQELNSLNPELKKGVKQGMILRVPKGQKKEAVRKEQGNLIKSINTDARKQLALLLPFNVSKIENDTVNSIQARLKKDKFLNLTLDFYSGALMAIDSARVLGIKVDVKILDSDETKYSSDVAVLAQQNNLEKADAVIGPFYQSNVEKLAELLEPVKTPVISPLSKDIGKKYANLYQSMPSPELLRSSIFEFMKAKNGNVLAVVDPKKGSVKQYIQELQKDVRIVGLSPKGTVVSDSLKVLFQKDRMNYVVLASESTGMILATTAALLSVQKEYQVQLVILEPNETLDFEEIPLDRLMKLKLLYPSLSRPNESKEAGQFDVKYKKINKIMPSEYAIRGFDVTFDTLLRLAQDKTFEETIRTSATEQIENKFDYVQNATYGYSNKGIYILYYDTDLTIKEAL